MVTDTEHSPSPPASTCVACGEPIPADAWACPACGKAVLAETGIPPKGEHHRRKSSAGGSKGRSATRSRRFGQRTVRLRMTPAAATGAVLGIVGVVIAAFLLGMMVGRS